LFIELSEFLRCPEPHQDTFCVVAPEHMAGRMIVRGLVGCPVCRREYRIEDGVVRFGESKGVAAGAAAEERATGADAEAVWALLGIAGSGGFVVLVGSAGGLADRLASRMDGVHLVAVNPVPNLAASSAVSVLTHPAHIPLRDAMARGVVLGAESTAQPWVGEATRVLLPGLRLVATADAVLAPGLERLAAGNGLWVGRKAGTAEGGRGKTGRPTP
jgi:hypothetical protein